MNGNFKILITVEMYHNFTKYVIFILITSILQCIVVYNTIELERESV